jgi:hypothetical protein
MRLIRAMSDNARYDNLGLPCVINNLAGMLRDSVNLGPRRAAPIRPDWRRVPCRRVSPDERRAAGCADVGGAGGFGVVLSFAVVVLVSWARLGLAGWVLGEVGV